MAAARSLPRVERLPLCRHRFVLHNGQPFFLRAAELQNSSFSSVEYMEKIWPKLVAQHVNTALGPIAWEDIEPVEGHFEWDLLEGLIAGARKHEIKLVLLWFGAWKNGEIHFSLRLAHSRHVNLCSQLGQERCDAFPALSYSFDARPAH